MKEQGWTVAGSYALYAFSSLSALFVLLYATLSPWWRTEVGRNIMAIMASLAAMGLYASLIDLTGINPPLYAETRFVILALLAWSVGKLIILFIREQLMPRKNTRRKK